MQHYSSLMLPCPLDLLQNTLEVSTEDELDIGVRITMTYQAFGQVEQTFRVVERARVFALLRNRYVHEVSVKVRILRKLGGISWLLLGDLTR